MRLSASKAKLAESCLGWLSLPCTDRPSSAASEGTRKHNLLEELSRGVPLPNSEGDWTENAVDIVTRLGLPARYDAEVSFAWTPNGSRVLGMSLERDYSKSLPTEFVGTADICHRLSDDCIMVADWKTGATDYGSPTDWGQLAFLAVMAADALGAKEVFVAYLYTETGEIVSNLLDKEAIEGHRVTMEWLWDLAQEPQEPCPGAHCSEQYCPAIASCPAVAAEFGQLVPVDNLTSQRLAIETVEDASRWLELKPRIMAAIKQLDAATRELAEDAPITVGDGYEYRIVSSSRTSFDVAKAKELLGERAQECQKATSVQTLRKVRR